MPDVNHFHVSLNLELDNQNEPMQAGFYFMASDTSLPAPYAVNAGLPEKELQSGFWQGTVANGTYTSTWLASDPLTSLGDVAALNGIATAIETFWQNAKVLSDSNTKYVGCTIRPLSGARQAVAGEYVKTLTTPIGGSGTQTHAPFTSMALGWRGVANGQSQRGRMFLPAIGIGITSGQYQVSSTTTAAICTVLANTFATLNSTYSVRPVIVHRRSQLVPPAYFWDTYSDISAIRMGSLLDTFKSRGNSITETFSNQPVSW